MAARVRLVPSVAWSGVVASAVAILLATLTPAGEAALVRGGFLCLWCGSAPLANLLRNVVLFVPLGFFIYLTKPGVAPSILAAAALSSTVEVLQSFIPGRNPFLVDVLANTAGGGLGAVLAATLPVALFATGRLRRRLFAVSVIVVAMVMLAPAYLLTPDPPHEDLYVHWNHPLSRTGGYDGVIFEAWVGNLPLPPGRIEDQERVSDRFLDSQPLVLRLEAGTPVPEPRGLLRVVSGPSGRELLTLTVTGTDVAASLPVLADRAGLSRPRYVAAGVLKGAPPGDTLRLTSTLRQDGGLRVEGPGGGWEGRGPDPSMGWSLLYFPSRIGPSGVAALGFVWCAILLFVPATLATGRVLSVAAGLGAAILLVALPRLVSFLAPLTPAGWGGAIVGWVTGSVVRYRLDHGPPAGDPAPEGGSTTVDPFSERARTPSTE